MKKGIIGFFIGMTISAIGFTATRTSFDLESRTYMQPKRKVNSKTYKAGQGFSYSMTGFDDWNITIPAKRQLDAVCYFDMKEVK